MIASTVTERPTATVRAPRSPLAGSRTVPAQRAARRVPTQPSTAVRACRAEDVAPPVRLSRAGRLTITLCVLATAILLLTGVVPNSSDLPQTTAVVTVDRGDTLWSIARGVAPDANVAEVVQRIRELNDLGPMGDGARLPIGLELTVPHG